MKIKHMAIIFLGFILGSLTGCSSPGGTAIDPGLQNLADVLTVSVRVASQQSDKSHTQPQSLNIKLLDIITSGTPSFDADGWLFSVDTFSTGSQAGSGATYTMSWSYRMYNISGEVITDSAQWSNVDKIEWLSTTTSESLTSHSYRQTADMVNYRNKIAEMTGSGTVEMVISGTEEATFSNGFDFNITSFEAHDGITLSPTGGTLFYLGTATWTASNGLYSGTLDISGPNSTSLTYTGSVYLSGQLIGTISYDATTYQVEITDNNGNTITPN